jgi:hypothetical protein
MFGGEGLWQVEGSLASQERGGWTFGMFGRGVFS